jgi:hypothetical protein
VPDTDPGGEGLMQGAESMGVVYLILVLFGIIVAVLWLLMPFAVFGIKGLAKQAIHEQIQ